MSYILLRKPYVQGDDFSSWEKVKFLSSPEVDDRLFWRGKNRCRRGDLFTVIPLERISDIENHAQSLWIAISDREVVECPHLYSEMNFRRPWFLKYGSSDVENMMRLCMRREFDCLSIEYSVAILYECTKVMKQFKGYEKYEAIMDGWLKGEIERQELRRTELTEELPALLYNLLALLVFGNPTREDLYARAADIETYGWRKYHEIHKSIVDRMLPLPEILLAIAEKRKIKLTWE